MRKVKVLISDFGNKFRTKYKGLIALKKGDLKNLNCKSDGVWYDPNDHNLKNYEEVKVVYIVNNHKEKIYKLKYKIGNIYEAEYNEVSKTVFITETDEKIKKMFEIRNKKIVGILKIFTGILFIIYVLKKVLR